MSTNGQPVGQIAYQAVAVASYGAALRAFAGTANRYGGGSAAWNAAQNAGIFPPGPIPHRVGRRSFWLAYAGQAPSGVAVVSSAGGSGYAANDLVTFVSLTHNRPIVIKVTAVDGGGNPTATLVVDQGGGVPAGGNGKNTSAGGASQTLTQASTTGAGTGATWTLATTSFGWQYPQPNPLAAA
jgi:hypothetical protein